MIAMPEQPRARSSGLTYAVLQHVDWLIEGPRGAAKILGLHPNTLRSRMDKLGIKRPGHGQS